MCIAHAVRDRLVPGEGRIVIGGLAHEKPFLTVFITAPQCLASQRAPGSPMSERYSGTRGTKCRSPRRSGAPAKSSAACAKSHAPHQKIADRRGSAQEQEAESARALKGGNIIGK